MFWPSSLLLFCPFSPVILLLSLCFSHLETSKQPTKWGYRHEFFPGSFPTLSGRQVWRARETPVWGWVVRGNWEGEGKGQSTHRSAHRYLRSLSSKTKGPGEEWGPRNHPEVSSQKVADFQCRCPYDSYGKNRALFWPLFGRRILNQYPAAPSSPGRFGLLASFVLGGATHSMRGAGVSVAQPTSMLGAEGVCELLFVAIP